MISCKECNILRNKGNYYIQPPVFSIFDFITTAILLITNDNKKKVLLVLCLILI